ncbi:hypothetical protein OC835_003780 [Tilletia horrida]|nr:hypothetical protein OC835_003780 [Tilletia horrida]
MSFSWRGIFHKHDHGHAAHPSHGSAIGSASGSVSKGTAVTPAGSGHLGLGAGVNTPGANGVAGSASYTANGGSGIGGSHASSGSSEAGGAGGAGISTQHANGHAVHGSTAGGPAIMDGELAGQGGGGGGMVARLRVWEELERPDMPLLGFENFGNTCYANSVLQALYHCQPFRESILKHRDETPREATPLPTAPSTPSNKAVAAGTEATATQQGSIPYALQDLFAQMTEQSIATAQAVTAPVVGNTATAAPTTGFSAKRAFGGLSMGGLGGIPPVPTLPAAGSGSGGYSMGSNGANVSGSGAQGGASGSGAGGAANGKDGQGKRAVDQAAIKAFLAALRKENVMFDSTMHQDAHEMLNFVLNRVGEELVDGKGSKKGEAQGLTPDASPTPETTSSGPTVPNGKATAADGEEQGKTCVHRLFEGKLTNETRCLTCETVSSRDESFLDLSIDIDQNSSVTSCLRQFSASETLRSRNKFFCDTCSGLQEAEKRMKVKQLPNVLALHLKRFKYEEAVQKYIKLAYRVVFPMQLRLFNTSDVATNPDRLYTLFAIVVHIGAGLHHGHYIAIVKVGSRWVSFDDDTVETIDEMDIAKYFGDTPGTGSAYVLFYQADDLDREALGLGPIRTATGGSNSSLSLPNNAASHHAATPSVGSVTGLFPVQSPQQPLLGAPGTVATPGAAPVISAPPQSPKHSGPRPSTADAVRSMSGGTFNVLRTPATPHARTPSPGDAAAAAAAAGTVARLGIDSSTTSTPPSGSTSRFGTLLGHRRASRQTTLPLGLEAHFAGLDEGKDKDKGKGKDKGGTGAAKEERGRAGGPPAGQKSGRKSLIGRFGLGKSSQH